MFYLPFLGTGRYSNPQSWSWYFLVVYIQKEKKRRIKPEKIERDHKASGHGRGYDLILGKEIIALKLKVLKASVLLVMLSLLVK